MKEKAIKFMDNHTGTVLCGIWAVTCGLSVLLYKIYLKKMEKTFEE